MISEGFPSSTVSADSNGDVSRLALLAVEVGLTFCIVLSVSFFSCVAGVSTFDSLSDPLLAGFNRWIFGDEARIRSDNTTLLSKNHLGSFSGGSAFASAGFGSSAELIEVASTPWDSFFGVAGSVLVGVETPLDDESEDPESGVSGGAIDAICLTEKLITTIYCNK